MLLRKSFFIITVYHRITDNNTGTRWPRRRFLKLFEELWLMIFTSPNLTRVFWLACTASTLRIRTIECIPYFFLYMIVIVILGIIVEKFVNNFILRGKFCFQKFTFFSNVAIILLSTRVWYSSWLCRFNFCVILFCKNSLTPLFISRSNIFLTF